VISQLNDELRVSQRNLQSLAEESGGVAATNRNDYSGFFTRIVRDSSAYYLLAYDPPSRKQDGKPRRIEVKVSKPGLSVRARRGYVPHRAIATDARDSKDRNVVTPTGMPAALRDALASPLPVSGLSMQVAAAPFMGSASSASVVLIVELLGRDLTLGVKNKVEVSFRAIDATGQVHAARNQAIALDLTPETRARVEQTGIRLLNRLELPPGRYQVRVAARDPVKDDVGAVTYDLDVPDFFQHPIGLSGLTVASLGSDMFTPRLDDQLMDVLPAAPMALRTFPQNDELALFAEVYKQSGTAARHVMLGSTVLAVDGRVMYEARDTVDSSDFDAVKRRYQYSVRIPLGDFAPGRYVLRVEAKSDVADTSAATRQIGFIVAPSLDRLK
jgi:hypothetical protein